MSVNETSRLRSLRLSETFMVISNPDRHKKEARGHGDARAPASLQ
jgi:hypothetical protein